MATRPLRVFGARLLVHDFPAAFQFYRDVLGLKPGFGNGEPPYAELFGGDHHVALFEAGAMATALGAPPPPERGGDACVMVFEIDDVDRLHEELVAKGLSMVAPPTDRPEWGLRTIHLRDPEGNLVEIYHPLPRPKPAPARPKRRAKARKGKAKQRTAKQRKVRKR